MLMLSARREREKKKAEQCSCRRGRFFYIYSNLPRAFVIYEVLRIQRLRVLSLGGINGGLFTRRSLAV